MPDVLAALAGFGITFKTMFRKPVTEQYPDVKEPTAPRYHGRHQLNRHPGRIHEQVPGTAGPVHRAAVRLSDIMHCACLAFGMEHTKSAGQGPDNGVR